MKQSHFKWLKAGVICCMAGVALIFAGYLKNGQSYVAHADLNKLDWSAHSDDSTKIISMPRTDLGQLDSVDIALSDLNLEILPSEDENCAIAWEISSDYGDTPVSYTVKDGHLSVTETDHGHNFYVHVDISLFADLLCGKHISQPADKVTLYVPAHAFKAVTINSQFGNISAEGLQTAHGSIDCVDGDASFINCQFSDFTLQNTLGNLTVSDSTLDDCEITVSDGDLTLASNQYQGSCSVIDKLGDVKLTASSDILQALGLQLSTGLGEIHLPEELKKTLPESEDDLTSYTQEGADDDALTIICKDGDISLTE